MEFYQEWGKIMNYDRGKYEINFNAHLHNENIYVTGNGVDASPRFFRWEN